MGLTKPNNIRIRTDNGTITYTYLSNSSIDFQLSNILAKVEI